MPVMAGGDKGTPARTTDRPGGGRLFPPLLEFGTMGATFELYEDRKGEYRWRLVHENGNVLADSGEGYASVQKARQGIESVRSNVPDASVQRID